MKVSEKLKRSVTQTKGDVFLRRDFAQFGGPAQVSRALDEMVTSGKLVRIGKGVYARAKQSVLSGKPIPVKPLEELAPTALKKLGVSVKASKALRAYNAGQTTQIPGGIVINTGRNRIVRKLSFGNVKVQYENDFQRAS